jgi:hypothetical protein
MALFNIARNWVLIFAINLNLPVKCIFIFGNNEKSEVDREECIRPVQSCFQLRTDEGNEPFLLLPCDAEDNPDFTIFMGVSVSFSNKCVRAFFLNMHPVSRIA